MLKDKSLLIISSLIIVIVLLLLALVDANRDSLNFVEEEFEEEIETADTAGFESGRPFVSLDSQSQDAAGIRVVSLTSHIYSVGSRVYGTVIDPSDLSEARHRIKIIDSEDASDASQEAYSRERYERALTLFSDRRSISERELQEEKNKLDLIQSKRRSNQIARDAVGDSIALSWGAILSGWVLTGSPILEKLLKQELHLVRLRTRESDEGDGIMGARIAPIGKPAAVSDATYVSDAPNIRSGDGSLDRYFVTTADLPYGTRVIATGKTGLEDMVGVLVPNASVVWHAGKPWVYRKDEDEVFSRIEIRADVDVGIGWFEQGVLQEGDYVVESGVQLLLSEELKYQIRNENED